MMDLTGQLWFYVHVGLISNCIMFIFSSALKNINLIGQFVLGS